MGDDLLRRAFGDDVTAVLARARTEVDNPVGGADGIVVVLHHQDGVAQIAQSFEGGQQPVVVARVQTDGRFIQHVQHAHQPRTHLGCQADALGFAA